MTQLIIGIIIFIIVFVLKVVIGAATGALKGVEHVVANKDFEYYTNSYDNGLLEYIAGADDIRN